jgi:2-keto-4-pentenoate hydratase/2-oxohepta-3-ene-1,7-dioic acid hydratase in catechol pathway
MKLCTFEHAGAARIGVVIDESVVDLAAAAPDLPREMTALLAAGDAALRAASDAAARAVRRLTLDSVRLLAPILRPPKFLAIGLNYADHVAEAGLETPKIPTVFNKQSTCVVGPRDGIHMPRVSSALDYEGELGFVIGRRCRHVPRSRAREVIAGYLVVDDVSVRDWQLRVPTWTMGKSFDTHGPIGPWLTTADEIGDPHALELRTWVNGELRQHSSTKELIFDCDALVEHLSTAFTLEPGDVIATGTPGGVGIAMKPPALLSVGDVVRIEIDGLGALENTVVPEPASEMRHAAIDHRNARALFGEES